MIQDGIDYGDGYEKATEPGDNLEFWTGEKWIPRHDQQECLSSCYKYRKPIKPKEEKMEEHLVRVNAKNLNFASWQAELTLDEAEKAGEEAKRIKAEIAKREEIGPGDWFNCGNILAQCDVREKPTYLRTRNGSRYYIGNCKKVI